MLERSMLLTAVAATVVLAGCGSSSKNSSSSGSTSTTSGQGGGSAEVAQGKQVFQSAGCASCHTLKAAGANGSVGPNLDMLKPSAAAVQAQVESGGGGMPAFKGRLSSREIHAVAAYVQATAGH